MRAISLIRSTCSVAAPSPSASTAIGAWWPSPLDGNGNHAPVRLSQALWVALAAVCCSATYGAGHPAAAARAARAALDPYPSTYRPLPRHDTLITHALVLDGKDHRLTDTDVLQRDGKLAALGRGVQAPAGCAVTGRSARRVTPGSRHVHSHEGEWRGRVT